MSRSSDPEELEDEDEEEQIEHDEDDIHDIHVSASALPPKGLKEISSLASWTLSSAKAGSGVAALRSLDMTQFWQSDGPQPHYLTIHFFKLVSIVHMRLFLDFEQDESYTPTKIQFWAGMGTHDLQEFCEMSFEQPKGWIDTDWTARPVLRAFLVQVRIVENHQNGKDTHLRGLQLFSIDPTASEAAPSEPSPRKVLLDERPKRKKAIPIRKAPWMMEPELR
ncbi:anaphase-promoting complex, subunit 10-domain-containing protein [Elsinoe ampelina]|uniref:Anaphase-promoting complex, subunit 10-domain-containing protein n=1 Tax=Elsinoe ampelina TaxID=302913 RepID=A0A6A6GAA0_9PEZI|nr:anaphase-promoting complex, subunit 10-domain-containing protein [Elsinoe ampelina]